MIFSAMLKKIFCTTGAVFLLLLFIYAFGYHCPIQKLTGFPCPGCNIITSAYWLFIKGNINSSLFYHALLIPSILLFFVCLYLTYKNKKKLRDTILIVWGILMIVYYVYRMIFIFPAIPMVYDENSLFGQLFHLHF